MKRHSNIYILFIVVIMTFISCEDLIEIDTPHNQLVTDNVFKDTTTIHAAVLGMYAKMANPDGTQGGLGTNATMFNGMSADEIHHFYSFLYGEFVTNSLLPDNIYVDNYWGFIYNNVYTANALIEGLARDVYPTRNIHRTPDWRSQVYPGYVLFLPGQQFRRCTSGARNQSGDNR
ncbi:hypothetical protein [Sinomicrobium oceani]|uniref:hypothetical protein n=1 Tax=Sinomicrobium oceani TaxID=1150368 RepID=UPI001FE5044E|nr:hypothetical protein [Sinomicrobium oceani]